MLFLIQISSKEFRVGWHDLMNKQWSSQVIKNFGAAASKYNNNALIQRDIAWQLAEKCSTFPIPRGTWVDLGAGTGLLANALEKRHPNQQVLRVDASEKMLALQAKQRPSQVWDLNFGLPSWPKAPSLLASSFVLHWLHQPSKRLQEWYSALPTGGWIALAVPVEGSFEEWRDAASQANVCCSAIHLPKCENLISAIPYKGIRYQKTHCITQEAKEVLSLLKAIRKIGAHTSPQQSLKVGELRRLKKAWPVSKETGIATLSWLIHIMLIQR